MLNLANRGVEVLRLDAVAFMWKRLGTNCQNQPEVHDLLQALRAATRIAAPALIHKAEAIVAPRDLVPYLGQGRHAGREANLAYHNNLMVQYWSSLASRDTALMTHVLGTHFPESFRHACWATYIRCHDDIGWAITEEDAAAVPAFLARGTAISSLISTSENSPGVLPVVRSSRKMPRPVTAATAAVSPASRALSPRLAAKDDAAADLAIQRMLLGFALICSFGGLPLLYMGDEIGLLNDYGFSLVKEHAHDNRWLHRPKMDWAAVATARRGEGMAGKLFAGVKHIISRRKAVTHLAADIPTRIINLGNPALFCFARPSDDGTLLALFNFTETWASISADQLRGLGISAFRDVLGGGEVPTPNGAVAIAPYGRLWLV